jgi:hypothetical protein
MLALLNSTVAMAIALCLLVLGLAAPFLALWLVVRIARDIRRIADALETTNRQELNAAQAAWRGAIQECVATQRRAANTVLGQ